MKRIILALAFLFIASLSYGQTTKTYSLEFNHDGLNTDGYEVSVDGVRTIIAPTCTGSGDTRLCTSPLTLVINTNHSVSVFAVGTFGEAGSIPFVCAVPKTPANPKVKK